MKGLGAGRGSRDGATKEGRRLSARREDRGASGRGLMMTLSWVLRPRRIRLYNERRIIDAIEWRVLGPRVGEAGGEGAPDLIGVGGEIAGVAEAQLVSQAADGHG